MKANKDPAVAAALRTPNAEIYAIDVSFPALKDKAGLDYLNQQPTFAGAIARPVKGDHGILAPEDVERAIRRTSDMATAPTRLICLENTHNAAGGVVAPVANMAAIQQVARQAGIPVHLDGARLFNAAEYLGTPVRELCRFADSVWIALCKGLGGPVGAVLAGDHDFMIRARRAAKMLGGGMRQAGLIAAPAIVALRDPYPVHRRDHLLAHELAKGLARIDASLVDLDRVQTNIVNCFIDRYAEDASEINRTLRSRGILANCKRTKIRFVTHSQVDGASVEAALDAVSDVLRAWRPHGAGERA